MIVRALAGTPTATSPAARSHAVARIVDLLGRLQRFGPGESRPKSGRQSRRDAASHRAAEQGRSCVSARANRLRIGWGARRLVERPAISYAVPSFGRVFR